MRKQVRHNLLLSPDESRLLEDLLHEERRRSMSGLIRDLVLEGLERRGKALPKPVPDTADVEL